MQQARLATDRAAGWGRLAAAVAVIAALWLGVLPQIGAIRRVRGYIERNEMLGIDPSVKFYSELPAMPIIQRKIADVRRRDGAAFQ